MQLGQTTVLKRQKIDKNFKNEKVKWVGVRHFKDFKVISIFSDRTIHFFLHHSMHFLILHKRILDTWVDKCLV